MPTSGDLDLMKIIDTDIFIQVSPRPSPLQQYNSLQMLQIQGTKSDIQKSVININDIFTNEARAGKIKMKA